MPFFFWSHQKNNQIKKTALRFWTMRWLFENKNELMETGDGANPYAACTEAIIKLGMFMYFYLQVHACKTMAWRIAGMRVARVVGLCLVFLFTRQRFFDPPNPSVSAHHCHMYLQLISQSSIATSLQVLKIAFINMNLNLTCNE